LSTSTWTQTSSSCSKMMVRYHQSGLFMTGASILQVSSSSILKMMVAANLTSFGRKLIASKTTLLQLWLSAALVWGTIATQHTLIWNGLKIWWIWWSQKKWFNRPVSMMTRSLTLMVGHVPSFTIFNQLTVDSWILLSFQRLPFAALAVVGLGLWVRACKQEYQPITVKAKHQSQSWKMDAMIETATR